MLDCKQITAGTALMQGYVTQVNPGGDFLWIRLGILLHKAGLFLPEEPPKAFT